MEDNGFSFSYQSKAFIDVINGKFPEDAIKKMNLCRLKEFVVNLVKYTSASAEAGTKSVSVVNNNKPKWWPTDVIFELDSLLNEVEAKEFRFTLNQLVIKCCEFFRNKSFKQIWLPVNRTKAVWVNDENFNSAKTRGVKRLNDISEANGVKKRKTLASKNGSDLLIQQTINRSVKAVVYLHDIFKIPIKSEPPSQQQFLKLFGLSLNNNSPMPTSSAPQFSKIIKLHNCPHVPLSSDVGKAIIKRENYGVPEYSTNKKIERLEWYINRSPPKKTPQHYEVTFAENKANDSHYYKFPKKQFHQLQPNSEYVNFLFRFCKPLKVSLEQEDLISKKKYYDSFKVTVVLHRLSAEQLDKYVCKNVKVRLTRTVCRPRRLCRKGGVLKSRLK